MRTTPCTYTVRLEGGTLRRGFWLYAWEVTTPKGQKLVYVGRTGDSSSLNAQSPFNRMGQHLGNLKNASMLRNHLGKRRINPERCTFRLVAYGPILSEAGGNRDLHRLRRDTIAAMEKRLREDLAAAGYDVMNTVNCQKRLDHRRYDRIHTAFAEEFPGLKQRN